MMAGMSGQAWQGQRLIVPSLMAAVLLAAVLKAMAACSQRRHQLLQPPARRKLCLAQTLTSLLASATQLLR